MSKVPHWVWVLVIGGAIALPLLGSYGLWDPIEVQHADMAREVAEKGSYADVTVDGRYSPRPHLYAWLVATGFARFGVNELAGRLPLALFAILGLLLAYRSVRRLFDADAGLLGAVVLITTPVYLFQARQLASEMPFYVSLIASVGGLAAFLWPANGKRAPLDLVIGAVGLIAGFLSRGLLLGTAFPLVCVTLAVIIGGRIGNRAEGHWRSTAGPDLSLDDTVRDAARSALKPLALALVLTGAAIGGLIAVLGSDPFVLLGGTINKLPIPPTFDVVFRNIGFGAFPWIALAPMALATFVGAQRGEDGTATRDAFPKLLIVIITIVGYAAAAVWSGYLGKAHFPGMPWLMIGIGVALTEARHLREHRPAWALFAVAFLLAIHQDFFMAPQSLAFAHLLEPATYPGELNIKFEMRLFGIGLSVLFFLALGGVPQKIAHSIRKKWWTAPLRGLIWLVNLAGGLLRALGEPAGRRYWLAAVLGCVAFGAWCSWYLTPQLSLHLSNKALFATYHRCSTKAAEPLAQYHVSGRGADYYNNGKVKDISTQDELFALLRKPTRQFVLIPANQLAPVDQAARQHKVIYHVLDDRSSQYLMLTNKLAEPCAVDNNPLRKLVVSKRPVPQHKVEANFEDRVKLIGYDLDDVVYRGGKFKLTMYFEVLAPMPSGYKLFIHFDQPSHRFHGDHPPLGGKYPTEYWPTGDFVIDPHEIDIPLLTTPSGPYTIWMGFWQGSNRLKVKSGAQDGVNRVRIGTFRVR